jgi:hypothetical protein
VPGELVLIFLPTGLIWCGVAEALTGGRSGRFPCLVSVPGVRRRGPWANQQVADVQGEHVLVVNVRVVHRLAYQVVPRSWQATSGVEVQLLIAGPKPNTNLTCLEQECQSTVADYNTNAQSYLTQDWRNAALPNHLDTSMCG